MNKIYCLAIALLLPMANLQAGFLDWGAGNFTDTVPPYGLLEYEDIGTGTGNAGYFGAGDVVTIIQKFSSINGVATGSGDVPTSVYGLTFLEVSSVTASGLNYVVDFQANSSGLSSFLTALGPTTNGISVGANSAFVLVSSSATVNLGTLSTSASDYKLASDTNSAASWNLEFMGGIDPLANDFYEWYATDNRTLRFDYTQNGTNTVVASAYGGFSFEGTSGTSASAGTLPTGTVTSYKNDGTAVTVDFGLLAPATVNSQAGASVAAQGFSGGATADFQLPSNVPEPNSLLVFASLAVAAGYRRRSR